MSDYNLEDMNWLAECFQEHRTRLLQVARLHIQPMLLRRISLDDLMQELYLAASKRLDYFKAAAEVPVFVRLRSLLLQTLVDLERKYLACQKRDAFKEIAFDQHNSEDTTVQERWNLLADTVSSPRTHLAKLQRQELVRQALAEMPDTDREVLTLRHFENLSNQECASVLGIEVKAASIRYIRALKRFQEKLSANSEFRV
jgi:RNA polymerase sigma-70 factor (ECF subfamily)